ncbi:MAG TPA: phosphotransferase [Roseiflexaceae bacterium]|nr:phosphotransferase [Roseiflexaceae bacterium]
MGHQFDFDPQLSALPLAFDRNAVARLFQQRWPGRPALAGGAPAIRVRRPCFTSYYPSARCITTYELLVEQPGAAPTQAIGVVDVHPAGLTARLFPDDPELPWLVPALDPACMGSRFARLLEEEEGAAPKTCTITPVRYKPGARCMIRYTLRTSSGRRTYYGKVLAQGGEQLLATLRALYRLSLTAPAMPRIPQPLGYWPEAQLLVQSAVADGAELHSRIFDTQEDRATREQLARAAGACLGGLHTSAGAAGSRRTFADDLDALRADYAPVAQIDPALAAQFEAAIGELAALARGRAEGTPVASHGAFRTDQLMIANGHLAMIDLDSFCWAHPARDVGNFMAYLRWRAIRQPLHAAAIEQARRAFLDGYVAAGPALDGGWLALYQAASMLKIVGRRFRNLTYQEWPLTPQLLGAALAEVNKGGSGRA